ncbi:MAG: nucleotide exchange factor GrpE [Bacteroidota bacterium]
MAEEITPKENTEQIASEPAEQVGAQTEAASLSELDLLKQKVEELQKQADSSKDQFLRKAAEFENYKRRTEVESFNLIKNANEGLIISLLPILGDFARSLKAGAENKDYEAFYKGVELIHNKFSKILEMQGLVPFDSVGKPFDVENHDALLQMPKEGVPPHTVIEEVERGYKLNDKVLRHAKVIVSAAPSPVEESAPKTQEEVKA